jgi:hypothetical protein
MSFVDIEARLMNPLFKKAKVDFGTYIPGQSGSYTRHGGHECTIA